MRAPGRSRRRRAESEVRERRLGEDRDGEEDRRLHDQHGCDVGQHVAREDRERAASGRPRGEHEVRPQHDQRRAAGQPGEDRDVGDPDRDHRGDRRAAIGGGEHDRDEDGGERVDDVGGAHRRLVHGAAALGGEQADRHADRALRCAIATTPTSSVVRAPTISWLRMSRPNWSAPSRWLPETPASESCGRTMVGSYGVHTSETSAASTTRPTSTPPAIRLPLVRQCARGLGGASARRIWLTAGLRAGAGRAGGRTGRRSGSRRGRSRSGASRCPARAPCRARGRR